MLNLIEDCPNLTSIPLCPTVEKLFLFKFNERLRIMEEKTGEGTLASYVDTSTSSSKNERHPEMRRVRIDNATYLKSLPMSALRHLMQMTIVYDKEMERLSEVGDVLHNCSSSLHSFMLINLPKLTSIFGGRGVGLEHLTALETLRLDDLPSLGLGDEEKEEQGMPWTCLHHSLRHLYLIKLPKVVNLPKGMQHLTSLQYLSIDTMNLTALPEWIGCLSSLQSLDIFGCKRIESLPRSMQQLTSLTHLEIYKCSERLHQRCQNPDGEDWPLIQHIVKLMYIPCTIFCLNFLYD